MSAPLQISQNSSTTPVVQYLFEVVWALTCAWTPKAFNPLRLLVASLFGAHISGTPFIHPRARITRPWNLTLADRACLGDRAAAYGLGPISIGARATIAQEAYLCGGSHDFSQKTFPQPETNAPIVIEADAFILARAFIMPGVTIGAGAIVGAMSVVIRDVPAGARVAGNPAKALN